MRVFFFGVAVKIVVCPWFKKNSSVGPSISDT